MASVIEVEYDCCGTTYQYPVAMRNDSVMIANASLADTILKWADSQHHNDHPRCPE